MNGYDWAVFPQVFGRHQSHLGQGWPVSLTASQVRRLSQAELEMEWRKGCWRQRAFWRLGGVVTDQNSERLDNQTLAGALVHQLRARVLSHPWPERPLEATPSRLTKKRLDAGF